MDIYKSKLEIEFYKIEEIRTMIYHVDEYFLSENNSIKFNIILGIDNIKNFPKIISNINETRNIILSKAEEIEDEIHLIKYKTLYEKILLNIVFVDNVNLDSFIRKNNDLHLIFDKDGIYAKNNNKLELYSKLENEEFYEKCIEFFFLILDLAIETNRNNILASNIISGKINKSLIYFSNYYINTEYNGKIELDLYGKNLITHLDKELKELLIDIFSLYNIDNWSYIFKSANYFRKIALSISRKLNYNYPKAEDVRFLQFLKNFYNK